MDGKFRIGWAECDITPENAKVELAGQYYQRMATGIHSRLKGVVLAMTKGEEVSLLISLDVVQIPKPLQDEVRAKIVERVPEIPAESIFLNATHSHNAPYVRPTGLFREWLPLDPDALQPADYIAFLKKRVAEAAEKAWKARRPGGVARSFASARIGHCRRPVYADGSAEMYGSTARPDFVGLEAGEDSGVELLFTFDEAKKPTGAIVNVGCPSQVMEAAYVISSDYMGAARELLKGEFGAEFHTLCQVSAAGCQAPRDLTRNYRTEPDCWHEDGVAFVAKRLFRAVNEGFAECGKVDFAPEFRREVRPVSLPVRRAGYAEYRRAKEELAELVKIMPEREAFDDFCRELHENEKIPGRPGPYDNKEHHFVQIQNRKAVVARWESQDETPNYSFDMNALRIGDCAMVSCPFELYLVFGQIIKARSLAEQTFIVQLSGDACGYLPSVDAERYGGYGGMIINGKVGSDGGYKLADEALQAINKFFK